MRRTLPFETPEQAQDRKLLLILQPHASPYLQFVSPIAVRCALEVFAHVDDDKMKES